MPTSSRPPREDDGEELQVVGGADAALLADVETGPGSLFRMTATQALRFRDIQRGQRSPHPVPTEPEQGTATDNMASLLGVPLKKEELLMSPAENFPLPKEYLGIEVELERWNVGRLPPQPWWSATSDGSLRNSGIEYVFRQPLFGQDIISAVNWLWEHIEERNCSSRCGIHVHLNVTDLSCEQLTKLLALYALIEKSLFNFVGHNRDKSNFCLPWYTAGNHLVQYVHYATKIQELTQNKKSRREEIRAASRRLMDMPRYSALNLASLTKFGTVEFRQLETTPDKERVFDWIQIILGLKYAACSSLPNDGWLRLFSEHRARGFLQEFFPSRAAEVLINSSNSLDEDMWPMLPTAQQLLCHSKETDTEEPKSGTDAWNTSPVAEREDLSSFVSMVKESY